MIYKIDNSFIIKKEGEYDIFDINKLSLDKILEINNKYNLKNCVVVNDRTEKNFDLTRKDVIFIHYSGDKVSNVRHPVKDILNDIVQKKEKMSNEELINLLFDGLMKKIDIVNLQEIDVKAVFYLQRIMVENKKLPSLNSELLDVPMLNQCYDLDQYMIDKERSVKIKNHNYYINADIHKSEMTIRDSINSLRRFIDDGIKIDVIINDCNISFMLEENKIQIENESL
jgi:hypothetical protein